MVEDEHSDYLTDQQRVALETALTRLGFSIPQIRAMVVAASKLPAMSPSELRRRR